jgi:hypothetical protein
VEPPLPREESGSKSPATAKRESGARPQPIDGQKRSRSSEEFGILDKARRAVAASDFGTALRLIERHTTSFPNSQLGEEREALRVRALKGAGLAREADQAARNFESRYPKSVLAPQISKGGRTTP